MDRQRRLVVPLLFAAPPVDEMNELLMGLVVASQRSLHLLANCLPGEGTSNPMRRRGSWGSRRAACVDAPDSESSAVFRQTEDGADHRSAGGFHELLAPRVERCLPGLIASRVLRTRRQPSGRKPEFWPQGQCSHSTPLRGIEANS